MLADDDHSARRDLATTLGHLVIEFGHLEAAVREFVWFCGGTGTANGPLLTADMTFQQSVAAAERVYRWRVGSATTPFQSAFSTDDFLAFPFMGDLTAPVVPPNMKRLCQSALAAAQKRNEALHGAWWLAPSPDLDGVRVRVSPTPRRLDVERVALSEIDDTTSSAELLTRLFRAVMMAIVSDPRYPIPR
ncbi:MAG: hypothetical protein WC273_12475 [Dehalococcoidia bacterium]